MTDESRKRDDTATPDDESLVRAAENCQDCLGWLRHCEAECCRIFTFAVTRDSDVVYTDDEVRVGAPLTADIRRYLELHGARVEGETVIVPAASCDLSETHIAVSARCSALRDDYLCSLHGVDQPECCRGFTWETASRDEWVITPRCLFVYKRRAGLRPHDPQPDGAPDRDR